MSHDQLAEYGKSLIQHGAANDRIYLMKLAKDDSPQIISYLEDLAVEHNYSKIFAKIPAYAEKPFAAKNYQIEAKIPGLYNGQEDGLFMGRYLDPQRRIDPDAERVQQVLSVAKDKAAEAELMALPADYTCRQATLADCEQMAELYQQVFASYPFPIHKAEYLAQTMAENLIYIGIWEKERLLAVASAECDTKGSNAEMTDFATHPDVRGKGFAFLLLGKLEEVMEQVGLQTCFTIARATSYGMNIVFARHGYQFSGTLIQNTQISGGLESMNVWHKNLQ
jgi:putative beta-lysine N-acetyltransferase